MSPLALYQYSSLPSSASKSWALVLAGADAMLTASVPDSMGYSSLSSQALSAPPYLLAFVVVLFSASLSDRLQNRSYVVCFHACLAAFGYAFIALAGSLGWNSRWRYAGVYPAAAGFFSAVTIIITWTINNQPSDSKKGTGLAMLNLIGQCGPLLGTRLYPDADKPLYLRGMSVCAGFMLLVAFLSLALRYTLARKNRRSSTEGAHIELEQMIEDGDDEDDDDDDDDDDEHAAKGRQHDLEDLGGDDNSLSSTRLYSASRKRPPSPFQFIL